MIINIFQLNGSKNIVINTKHGVDRYWFAASRWALMKALVTGNITADHILDVCENCEQSPAIRETDDMVRLCQECYREVASSGGQK